MAFRQTDAASSRDFAMASHEGPSKESSAAWKLSASDAFHARSAAPEEPQLALSEEQEGLRRKFLPALNFMLKHFEPLRNSVGDNGPDVREESRRPRTRGTWESLCLSGFFFFPTLSFFFFFFFFFFFVARSLPGAPPVVCAPARALPGAPPSPPRPP